MNNAKIEWDVNYNTLTLIINSKNYYLNPNNEGYFFGWDDFGNRVSCIREDNGNFVFVNEEGQVTNYNQYGNVIEENIVYSEKVNNFLYGNYEYKNEYGSVVFYRNGNFVSSRDPDGSICFETDGGVYYYRYLNDNLYVDYNGGFALVDENGNYYLLDKDNNVVCYDENFMPIEKYNPEIVVKFLNENFNIEDSSGVRYQIEGGNLIQEEKEGEYLTIYKDGKPFYTKYTNGGIYLDSLYIIISPNYSTTQKGYYIFVDEINGKSGKCFIDEDGNYCLKYSDNEYYVYDKDLNLITNEGKYSLQIIDYLSDKISFYRNEFIDLAGAGSDQLKVIGENKFEILSYGEFNHEKGILERYVSGTAYRDEFGNYIFLYNNGDTRKINPFGELIEKNINGITTQYNKEFNRRIINYDDRFSASNLNCINFDEEKYYEIIKLLKNDYNKKDVIASDFNKISQIINNAYDVFSNPASLENEINLYYNKIIKLSEIVNYASLLYRGFDRQLEESLNQLIDDLFEDGETAYEKRYLDMIQDDLTINNDGIYEYDKDIDFKQLDSEMVAAIIEEKLMKEYNLIKISKEDAYQKYGDLDTFDYSDAYYAERTVNINGVDFDFVYRFNLENINVNPIIQCANTEKQINEFSNNYDNVDLLSDLSREMVIVCDWNDGHAGSWCTGAVNEKGKGMICLHASYPVDADNGTSGILAHEMGHAVDHFVGDRKHYLDTVYENYNNNQPMYMMYVEPGLNMYYDGKFAKIYYDEESPYIVVNDSKYYLNGYDNVNVNGDIYQLVSCGDAVTHCKETYAEAMAFFFDNPGELLARLEYDETYRLVLDELAYFLESEYGEDISWYKEWQVEN